MQYSTIVENHAITMNRDSKVYYRSSRYYYYYRNKNNNNNNDAKIYFGAERNIYITQTEIKREFNLIEKLD